VERHAPVVVIVLVLVALWYVATVLANAALVRDAFERNETSYSTFDLISGTLNAERPLVVAPHQMLLAFWNSVFGYPVNSPRSLLYHGWITLSATLVGFLIGTAFGILLSVLIVHLRTLQKSLMPWIICSQMVPILAVAPMVIVVLGAINITGLLPKALISTYLSFFPVAVGMVKGLRSPELIQLDLMRTYNASAAQTFWKLRVPASIPFLFTSMKVAIAASVVGAIVGELPTGAVAGIGSKLLAGAYYSQTIDIWAALIAGSVLAALLVAIVALAGKLVDRAMGTKPQGRPA
jgi:NitT/TauT family transport system permease protein